MGLASSPLTGTASRGLTRSSAATLFSQAFRQNRRLQEIRKGEITSAAWGHFIGGLRSHQNG